MGTNIGVAAPNEFLTYALRYAAMGWPVFPLAPNSKLPLISKENGGNGVLDATLSTEQVTQWWTEYPNSNIGIATGVKFFVLDIDIKHRGDETIEALESANGKLPDTLQVITGTGGRHYFFQQPDFKVSGTVRNIGQGLDIRGWHNYIVAPPSIHPDTHAAYAFDGMDEFEQQSILPAPAWLLSKLQPAVPARKGPQVLPEKIDNGTRNITLYREACEMRRRNNNREEILAHILNLNNGRAAEPLPLREVVRIVDSAMRYEPAKIFAHTYKSLLRSYEAQAITEQPSTKGANPNWESLLCRDSKDRPEKELMNVEACLAYSPDYYGALAYDEFTLNVFAMRDLCGGQIKAGQKITDTDISLLSIELKRKYDIRNTKDMMFDAIGVVARRHKYHPVRDYLNGLQWDGDRRIDTWLTRYLGVEISNYSSAVGRRWLISAVARIMQPGCKADCCLILEGEQGIGKSTVLAFLARDWFGSDIEALGSRESKMQLRGKWIIEIGELSAMGRAEVNATKSFISAQSDNYRAPWGRVPIDVPRECIFAGTTNQDSYLKDETGNRRFWPVRCRPVINGKVDIQGIIDDRDQLWAEAAAMYHDGARWYLDDQRLIRESEEHQSSRMEGDAWQEIVQRYLATVSDTSIPEVLTRAIDKPVAQWTQADRNRVGRILRLMGYERYRYRISGTDNLEWRFKRGDTD